MSTSAAAHRPQPSPADHDVVALGEVMLRLDPGERRVRDARSFDVWIGGGEFNVAHAMSSCFGMRSAVATALVDNEVGALMRTLIRSGGVETGLIRWVEFDGVGAAARNGLNFTERGHGRRPAAGEYDRAGSAAARLEPGDIDWDGLFSRRDVRWLHTGGVFASLSPASARTMVDAVRAAARHGVRVSFDVNHRASLWRNEDQRRLVHQAVAEILPHVSLLLANLADFERLLGRPQSADGPPGPETFRTLVERRAGDLPAVECIATGLRETHSASRNAWSGIAWSPAGGIVQGHAWDDLEILDRVGGGDAFAAGILYGLCTGQDLQRTVDLAVAHGALAMSTPGDTSSVSLNEVEAAADGLQPMTRR